MTMIRNQLSWKNWKCNRLETQVTLFPDNPFQSCLKKQGLPPAYLVTLSGRMHMMNYSFGCAAEIEALRSSPEGSGSDCGELGGPEGDSQSGQPPQCPTQQSNPCCSAIFFLLLR